MLFASKCHFLLNFVLFSCIEVWNDFAFWGGLIFRVNFPKCALFCVKMSVFEISRLLGRGDQPFCQVWELFCKKLETGYKLWSLPPQFKKMLCADLLQFFVFCWKMLFSLQPNNLGPEVPNWCIHWCTQNLNSMMHPLMHPGP